MMALSLTGVDLIYSREHEASHAAFGDASSRTVRAASVRRSGSRHRKQDEARRRLAPKVVGPGPHRAAAATLQRVEFGRDREGHMEVASGVGRYVRNVGGTDRAGFDAAFAFEDQVGWLPGISAPGPIQGHGRADRGAGR